MVREFDEAASRSLVQFDIGLWRGQLEGERERERRMAACLMYQAANLLDLTLMRGMDILVVRFHTAGTCDRMYFGCS